LRTFTVGEKIGENILLEYLGREGKHHMGMFECLKCSKPYKAKVSIVQAKDKKYCGCYNHNIGNTYGKTSSYIKLGIDAKTSEYHAWNAMRHRCNSPKNRDYHKYGAIGITVCEEWNDVKTGYIKFLEDMGNRPSNKHGLYRIDVTKGYSKENCEWIMDCEKAVKTNKFKSYIYEGTVYSSREISELFGHNITMANEYERKGLSDDEVIEQLKLSAEKKKKLAARSKEERKILNKIRVSVRGRLHKALDEKLNKKKNDYTKNILGLDMEQFFLYLESKFEEGMTWDNYGNNGWHIDHIIPLSCGDTEEEIYLLSHYTNLQPLWAEENLRKNAKLDKSLIPKLTEIKEKAKQREIKKFLLTIQNK